MKHKKFRTSLPSDDDRYNHDLTGWFILSPRSRNQEIADYLNLSSVYCVGSYPGKYQDPKSIPEIVFIQETREIDPRNGKIRYLVVPGKRYIKKIMEIMRRPSTPTEQIMAQKELAEAVEKASKDPALERKEGRLLG